MIRRGIIAGTLLAMGAASGGVANETLSELPTGGIVFQKPSNPTALAIESQDIRLSPDAVTIAYRLNNTSDAPLDLTLGFRLPELDFGDPDTSYAIPGPDPVNFIGVAMKIDGKPVPLPLVQKATFNGKDVSAVLRGAKLAMVPIGTFQNDIAAMPPASLEQLQKQDLIKEAGTDVEGKPLYFPAWTVKTEGMRKLTVQPHKPVEVSVRYLPSVGVTRDTVLRKAIRDQSSVGPQVREKKATYCIDQGFLNGLDILTGAGEANAAGLVERRIKLLFNPDGETPAPVPSYHLVVDKGKPQRIVSFCSDNLKKVSATTFEAKLTDYTPKAGFDLLLIDKGEPNPK